LGSSPGLVVFVCALLLLLAACGQGPRADGTLEGHVTIGPLTPVQREGEPPATPSPEAYAARKVVVFSEDGVTEIGRLPIDSHGNFYTELPAGTYVVDINHLGIDTAAGLPKEIEIKPGETTVVDIDIDTGIR
jgi:hypothetical protein